MSNMIPSHDPRKMSFDIAPEALLNFGGETSHGGPPEDDITWDPQLKLFSREEVSRRGSLRDDPESAPAIEPMITREGTGSLPNPEGRSNLGTPLAFFDAPIPEEEAEGKGKEVARPTGQSDPRSFKMTGWAFGKDLPKSGEALKAYNPRDHRLFPYSGPPGTHSPTNVQGAFGPSRGGRTSVLSSRSGGGESQQTGRGLSEYKGPNYEELVQVANAAADQKLAQAVLALVDEVKSHRDEVVSLREDLRKERERRVASDEKSRQDMARLLGKFDELDAKFKNAAHGPPPAQPAWSAPPSGPAIQIVSAPQPATAPASTPRVYKGF